MSDKKKFPHATAMETAKQLVTMIAPQCERIIIAGSLRRMKPEVGDIEILLIPSFRKEKGDLFDEIDFNATDRFLTSLLENKTLAKRPSADGHFAWGDKNKLGIHVASGIPVDIFSTTAENWPVALVVRTGGKETNLKLTTTANQNKRSLQAYGHGVKDLLTGEIYPCHSEEDVFRLCFVPYVEPTKRA